MGFEFNGQPVTSIFNDGSPGMNGTFEVSVPILRQQGYTVVDLEAYDPDCLTAIGAGGFAAYPGCESGFLVIEDHGEIRYRELNHFAKAFIGRMLEEII